ncbi:Iron-sulfur cluster binding protein [Candidatus Syntrophocurvum alkaliphilum]|uniref:Iron-sulfur cluster binding protein n=1 Tax=Candidatus Syntrophocurvum alkaliphilum TaxID=2293317 RepID=A0A6I6DDE9_9FIRM|nr:4Fe-4S dicluster domain-containing protein [Candidatus Syntrophocurvum alkaliphilum]QGT98621.1 Iron-sulfur cluster binding protein [Candidatus Syntrophocurvum alkaliphilum]
MAKVLKTQEMERCIACYSCMQACAREVKKSFSLQYAAIRIKTRGGLQSKLIADICRGCTNPPCAESCSFQALVPRKGGGVKLIEDKCTGCEKCIPACPIGYIKLDPTSEKIIMCIHCGICAKYCPHEIIKLKEVR